MTSKPYEWKLGQELPVLGAHSVAKHRIVDRYVRRYVEICTATPVQQRLSLTVVDGYAGGGRYIIGETEVPGSPIILLNAIAEMQEALNAVRPNGFELRVQFIFVDSERLHTDFLRSEIEASPFAPELDRSIEIWTGDFNERVGDAVAVAKRLAPRTGRSLFLLDQFGWSQVTFASVRSIMRGLPKAEVFLTFMVDSLIDYLCDRKIETRGYRGLNLGVGQVRELLSTKEKDKAWRVLIQNGLYTHLQKETGAEFYSPFFVRSPDAHRCYWFIHISRHREARNEIGNVHWEVNNTSLHHGRPGLKALGFSPSCNFEDLLPGFDFDSVARERSRVVLMDEIPRLIHDGVDPDVAPTLEEIFGAHCNETPVTRRLFEEVLRQLRDEGELTIEDARGREKPRANTVNWTDRIVLTREPRLFGPFGPWGNRRGDSH